MSSSYTCPIPLLVIGEYEAPSVVTRSPTWPVMIEPPALGESALAAAAPGLPASTSAIAAVDPAATGAPAALGEAETVAGEAEPDDTGDAVTDAGAAPAGAG